MAEEDLNDFWLLQELLEKLKEAEESHGSLQAECEQYRTVLAETVSDRVHGVPIIQYKKPYCSLFGCRICEYGVYTAMYFWFPTTLGRNAETSAEECGRGGAGLEVQDG